MLSVKAGGGFYMFEIHVMVYLKDGANEKLPHTTDHEPVNEVGHNKQKS